MYLQLRNPKIHNDDWWYSENAVKNIIQPILYTFSAIVKFIVTFSGKIVPSGIPSTLALMIDDPTTVSGGGLRIGNNVD